MVRVLRRDPGRRRGTRSGSRTLAPAAATAAEAIAITAAVGGTAAEAVTVAEPVAERVTDAQPVDVAQRAAARQPVRRGVGVGVHGSDAYANAQYQSQLQLGTIGTIGRK